MLTDGKAIVFDESEVRPTGRDTTGVRGITLKGDARMLVCWSVGNFVSTQVNASNMVGGMVKLDFVKDEAGARLASYEFITTITQSEPYSPNLRGYKLSDYTDELAARNTVRETAGEGGTRGGYIDYCAQVLGEAFDYDTLSVHGTM